MNIINVQCKQENTSYPIYIEWGILDKIHELIQNKDYSCVLIISNERVMSLHGRKLLETLSSGGFTVKVILMGDGEEFKNPEELLKICRQLIIEGADRHSLVIPFGGGVTGDLGGFAASTILRGVHFIHIPTTLISQVDSSIGGKLGVNLPEGKNLWGTFRNPRMVITDPSLLLTLPQKEFSCGMAEVIKSAIISSPELLDILDKTPKKAKEMTEEILSEIVLRTAQIKVDIVSRDFLEKGERMKLNLGHTAGHGLERAAAYRAYNHGEAVSVGIMASLLISRQMGILEDESLVDRIRNLLIRFGLPVEFSGVETGEILEGIKFDKKKKSSVVPFALPVQAGKVIIKPVENMDIIVGALTRLKEV